MNWTIWRRATRSEKVGLKRSHCKGYDCGIYLCFSREGHLYSWEWSWPGNSEPAACSCHLFPILTTWSTQSVV